MPALATVEDVRNVDLTNSLRNVSDGNIQCILDGEAACMIGEPWGAAGLRVIGESLVAAHITAQAIKGPDGPAGAVTSEAAGGLSRSYASPGGQSGTDDYWSSTSFGRRYLALRRTLPTSPTVLGLC